MSNPKQKKRQRKAQAGGKRRNRIEGRIARLAREDVHEALELAGYGHKRTRIEECVWHYLNNKKATEHILKHNSNIPEELLKPYADEGAEWVWEVFREALDREDADSVRAFAKAVEDFEESRKMADKVRSGILIYKLVCEEKGGTMTLKQLAAELNRKDLGDLRRIAKSLGFPLAKAGRPKNSGNKR